jgi:hypothetical protein
MECGSDRRPQNLAAAATRRRMLGPPIHLRLAALIGIAFLDHEALTPPVRRERVGLPAVLSERESAKQTLTRLFPAPLVVIPDVDPTTGKCVGWD